MNVYNVYTSGSCNRVPNSVDWSRTNEVCYAVCNAVAVCARDKPSLVEQLLIGHTGRVNSVKWIKKKGHVMYSCDELVSCSTDGTCKIWRRANYGSNFENVATLSGHQSAVTVLDALYIDSGRGEAENTDTIRTLVASASVDSNVKIWHRDLVKNEFTCMQSISFGGGFALSLSWSFVKHCNVPLLACGGDDHKIHVFIEEDKQLKKVQTLLGHEDWIRGTDFCWQNDGTIFLASCSQDHYIRIWSFSARDPTELDLNKGVSQLSIEEDIKLKENTFTFHKDGKELCFAVTLESVLQGHDNWVYSVQWQPPEIKDGSLHQYLCLLSSSMDKTMIIWKTDPESGIWLENARVGEVGGNSLGYFGGIFSPDGRSIMSHGFQGAFELFTFNPEKGNWLPRVMCGGHFDSVQDISWQPGDGHFLLSVGADQTTRCHCYWKTAISEQKTWHEIARPQIHGYNMQCLSMINRYSFASGADEKVVRIFQATKNFCKNFAKISALDVSDGEGQALVLGASVPALGLSNKAVNTGDVKGAIDGHEIDSHPNEQYPENYFLPIDLNQPPTEVDLMQNTLWPEVQKLYGHGYEIFALASHPDGTLLASSCKASKADHAGIILWDARSWKQLCTLLSHSLTVTQLAFSHNGEYLLSVSRDRTWTVYQRQDTKLAQSDMLYKRLACTDKKTAIHSRIIWGCAWSHDDKYFVTVSRDKKAIIWSQKEDQQANTCVGVYNACSSILLPDAVTAVDFAPVATETGRYLLCFGFENGCIMLHTWSPDKTHAAEAWECQSTLSQSVAHHMPVKRVKFRPRPGIVGIESNDKRVLQLASCGGDHLVRIYNIDI